MADFDLALPYVLSWEGGYSDQSADRGGPTNFGITEETARASGYSGDMRGFTKEHAAEIYRRKYWRFAALDDQRVATKIFDMVVNFGPGHAIRIVQEALNGIDAGLSVDGAYGPRTENTINAVQPGKMLDLLVQDCIDHYTAIVHRDPTQAVFLKGWLRRAQAVPNA